MIAIRFELMSSSSASLFSPLALPKNASRNRGLKASPVVSSMAQWDLQMLVQLIVEKLLEVWSIVLIQHVNN